MSTTMDTQMVMVDDAFTSPCGCPGCEKWADCDYCGTCSPEIMVAEAPRFIPSDLDDSRLGYAEWLEAREVLA